MDLQVDPSFQLASTCESVRPGLKEKFYVDNCSTYGSFLLLLLDVHNVRGTMSGGFTLRWKTKYGHETIKCCYYMRDYQCRQLI